MKETLNYLFEHNTLSKEDARNILIRIAKGEFSDPEIAAFLTVFLMRKITADELGGFREALLDLCVPVDLQGLNTIDVCGTGGDEKNTFNISTLTAFVLAGSGVKVVKHGNYGVSSACGSSNVLENLGYKFSNDNDKIRKEIEESNITYLHAPFFHPAMKNVGPVRKSLKVKTFFNLLGPMVNPARPDNQIVGVYNPDVQDLYNQVYKKLGLNYFIIYSLDGYDEISLTGDFTTVSQKETMKYSPEDLGYSKTKQEDLFGGNTVDEAMQIFKSIISGNGTKEQNEVVIANAMFGLKCYFPDLKLEDCKEKVKESLLGRKAAAALKKLIDLQREIV